MSIDALEERATCQRVWPYDVRVQELGAGRAARIEGSVEGTKFAIDHVEPRVATVEELLINDRVLRRAKHHVPGLAEGTQKSHDKRARYRSCPPACVPEITVDAKARYFPGKSTVNLLIDNRYLPASHHKNVGCALFYRKCFGQAQHAEQYLARIGVANLSRPLVG